MAEEFLIRYSYRMEGHDTVSGDDVAFYRSLPKTKEEYRNSKTGIPEVPRPDAVQLITILGSTVLSSTVLATAIKSYLDYKKTKITISSNGSKKSITFEGPSLQKSQPEITQLIDALLKESVPSSLEIHAEHVVPTKSSESKSKLKTDKRTKSQDRDQNEKPRRKTTKQE